MNAIKLPALFLLLIFALTMNSCASTSSNQEHQNLIQQDGYSLKWKMIYHFPLIPKQDVMNGERNEYMMRLLAAAIDQAERHYQGCRFNFLTKGIKHYNGSNMIRWEDAFGYTWAAICEPDPKHLTGIEFWQSETHTRCDQMVGGNSIHGMFFWSVDKTSYCLICHD